MPRTKSGRYIFVAWSAAIDRVPTLVLVFSEALFSRMPFFILSSVKMAFISYQCPS